MRYFISALAIVALSAVDGFVNHQNNNIRQYSSSSLQAQTSSKLFDSEGWKPIKSGLDQVPVFTVATKEGHPLAYTIDIQGKQYNAPCFYCNVADSLAELEGAKEQNTEMEGLDIVPFPLGQAFEMWSKDEAVIVPSKEAILQAGAPPGTNPIGQQVPLFACMEIMEEGESGDAVLPVFMSLDDANAAVREAVATDGGDVNDFDVACLSLVGCVEQLATVPETPAFHFIPPSSSMKYIQEYLS